MNFNKNLKTYQKYLSENQIDFAIVFSNNEFLQECSALNQNARYLLSGFTGTAGDMLITPNKAYLFVDGRYHIQVDEQTDPKFITPVKLKMGEKRNDKIFEIIKNSKIKIAKLLVPINKISGKGFEDLSKKLKPLNTEIINSENDIVCKLFATEDKKKVYKVWNVGIKQVGKNTQDKLKGLKKYENDFLLVFSNDEICYLANIRANQNPYSSSLNCFALIGENVVRIFCDKKHIPNEVINSSENVIYNDFSEFDNIINNINKTIYYEQNHTPYIYIYKLIEAKANLKKLAKSPIAKMKATKNKTELAYIKECYRKSDIGILNAIKFLNKKIENKEKITAGDFLKKLIAFEKEQGVIDLSFNTILAINERSAIIHCTEFDEKQIIKEGDLILLDFGVYFEGGYATDMTRTFAVGKKYKNELLKQVYTTVLKAFLNTLNYKIKPETMYFDLDKKARSIIKKANFEGFNFNHGTGHGIGLNVHEMPPILSPSKFAKEKIKPNMVFSIEPGLYKENIGGVRIENSVYTTKTKTGIKIESLTNLPFDEKLIIFDMLNTKEQKWLNDYQSKVLK